MEKREEERQEASVPVQGRVSLVALAKMALYFESKGYRMRSVSQLLGWSLEMIVEVLENNGFKSEVDGVRKAREVMIERDLSQRGMDKRGRMKLATAIRFEGLREEGYEPKIIDKVGYNILHNKNSIKSYVGRSKNSMIDRAVEIYREKESRDNDKGIETLVKERMTDDEFSRKMKEIERRDKEQRKLMDEAIYGKRDGE